MAEMRLLVSRNSLPLSLGASSAVAVTPESAGSSAKPIHLPALRSSLFDHVEIIVDATGQMPHLTADQCELLVGDALPAGTGRG